MTILPRALAIASCAALAACATPSAPAAEAVTVEHDAAPATPRPPPVDASTDAAPTLDASSPRVARFRYTLVPTGTVGERTLFFVNDDGTVREKLATIAPNHRCATHLSSPGIDEGETDALQIGCGVELSASARVESDDGKITVGISHGKTSIPVEPRSREVPIPPETTVELDPALSDTAPIPCTPSTVAPVLDVRVDRTQARDDLGVLGPTLVVRVPALGIAESFGWSEYGYCAGTRYRAANRLVFRCSGGESGSTETFALRDGSLFVDTHWESYDGNQSHPLGGIAVPCGATLKLPRVQIIGSKWSPAGNYPVCQYAEDRCKDPCFDKLTDQDGDLTDEGRACESRCDDASGKCWHRFTGQ